MLVGGGLLVMKSVTLVQEARAQTAMTGQAPVPEPKDTTQVAVTDPVIDDSESNSAAEVDVLTSLSKRRQQLDAREQSLNMQANLIAAAEQRVDGKIDTLKGLQTQMQTLLGQRDAAEQAQLNALVKSYSSMKPADAARIFNSLDDTVELNVAAAMKSDVLGAVLAKMQADAAEKLTVRLANRLKLPQPAAVAAANAPEASATQQMASVDPSAQSATVPAAANAAGALEQNAATPTNPPAQSASTTPPASKPEAAPAASAPKQAQATPAPSKPQAAAPAPAKQAAMTPSAQAKPQTAPAKNDPKQQATAAPAKAPTPAPAPAAKAKNG
jgi:flagellar motility protein MotE (MotC chaperone)